jgi:hypothetical protein
MDMNDTRLLLLLLNINFILSKAKAEQETGRKMCVLKEADASALSRQDRT